MARVLSSYERGMFRDKAQDFATMDEMVETNSFWALQQLAAFGFARPVAWKGRDWGLGRESDGIYPPNPFGVLNANECLSIIGIVVADRGNSLQFQQTIY